MSWINVSTALALVISLLVFLQGWTILQSARQLEKAVNTETLTKKQQKEIKQKGEVWTIIGWLTALLAALGMIINILFLSTEIAISTEFGGFIVQGTWAMIFLALCFLGLILCIAFGWNLARLREGWGSWGIRLHLLGFLVWLVSISILVTRINTIEVNEAPIYLYDIWWPPLLVWLTVGFTDITLTILRIRDGIIRTLTATSMVILVFLIAIRNMPPPDFAYPSTATFWSVIAILLLIPVSYEVIKPSRMRKATGQAAKRNALPLHFMENSVSSIEKEQKLLLASLAIIVFGAVILLFSPSVVGPAPGIIAILLGWAWMTEVIADGLFHRLYQDYKDGQWTAEDRFLNKAFHSIQDRIKAAGEPLAKIISLPNLWTALVKVFLVVAVLIAFNEYQNRGKTILQPFQAIGFKEPAPGTDNPAALVDSVDDRLINDLSILNQQLQPIIIFPTSSGFAKRIDYIQAGNTSTTIDAALKNSGEFDLGSVKVPANVLIAPVQGLVRPWFNVREVSGSIISNGDQYVMLVNASDGGTWLSETPAVQNIELSRLLPGLVEEIAFLMLSSEDSVQSYGLTKSWQAYRSFRAGLENFQLYESHQDYDALTSAVQNFREATRQDPNFALAYYRLGLALQQNRQPWQAENALRMGLSLKPDSVPFKNALAYHLYFFSSYTPFYPAVLPLPESFGMEAMAVKRYQARILWHQIVNLPSSKVLPTDLASAYFGLCNAAIDDNNRDKDYLAYFYCFKSHTLIERLPHDQQAQDKIRRADASALNKLGVIVYGRGVSKEKKIQQWVCLNRDPGKPDLSFAYHPGYASAALRYYEKALALQPQDNLIRCNAAIIAMLLGHDQGMRELEQTAQAHYVLGSNYLDQARKEPQGTADPSPYYKEALKEYKKAIDLNPTFHEALNAYAYTYWVFRLRWPEKSLKTLGIDPFNNLAEYYADKALRLVKMQDNKYLEIIYENTKAEVLIGNGDFQKARTLLLELNPRVPDSYILDEIRWNLAQTTMCVAEESTDGSDMEEMEKEANTYLEEIQKHEEMLETFVFSYTGNRFLTEYRLPCKQFQVLQK